MSDAPISTGRSGLFYGIGAYTWWGIGPAFFPLLLPAGAGEVLAHRVVWTAVFLLLVLAAARRLSDLRRLDRRTWLLLLASSALVSTNWGVYIIAVTTGHVVDAALGYFINPLLSVALGVVVFRERMNRLQVVALLIAVAAVVVLTAQTSGPPWIALTLAGTFAVYGAIKKVVKADPRVSVGVEAMVGTPFALGFLIFLGVTGGGHFVGLGAGHTLLLILAGPVTAVPLLLFAAAAQRLQLITLGLLQYLNPAIQMAWGVLVAREAMPGWRWVGFALIWAALVVLTADALRRRPRKAVAGVVPAVDTPAR